MNFIMGTIHRMRLEFEGNPKGNRKVRGTPVALFSLSPPGVLLPTAPAYQPGI